MFSNFYWFLNRNSTFNQHFADKDLQLTTLLDDDDLISEVQSKNKELLDYIQKDHMFELIRYITEVPEDDSNSKRAYRYPYYSVMLLSYIGNSKPEYYIVDDKYFLYKLLNFFQQDQDVNQVLGGFISYVLQQIQPEIVIDECFENLNIQQGMVRQLQSRSVSDFLVYLLKFRFQDQQKYKNQKINLLQNILRKIDDSSNFEVSANISFIVQEILDDTEEAQLYLEIFFYGDFINSLCKSITQKAIYPSLSSSTILFNLLNYLKNYYLNQNNKSQITNKIDLDYVFSILDQYCADWIEYLLQQNPPILGQQKLKILEIIGVTVFFKNETFINRLYSCNIFKAYNQLFITYEQHDILHFQYYNLINQIIGSQIDILIKNLFEENQFIELLLQCTKQENNEEKQRKGQLGFITLLGVFIEEQAQNYDYLKQFVQNNLWQEFRTQYLERAQKISNFELGQEKIEDLFTIVDLKFDEDKTQVQKDSDTLNNNNIDQNNKIL